MADPAAQNGSQDPRARMARHAREEIDRREPGAVRDEDAEALGGDDTAAPGDGAGERGAPPH